MRRCNVTPESGSYLSSRVGDLKEECDAEADKGNLFYKVYEALLRTKNL